MAFLNRFKDVSSLFKKTMKTAHGQDGTEWVDGGGISAFHDEDTRFLKAAETVAGLDGHAMRLARDRGLIAVVMTCIAAFSMVGWYVQSQKTGIVPIMIPVDQLGQVGEIKVVGNFTPTVAMMNMTLRDFIDSCFTRYPQEAANIKHRQKCNDYSVGINAKQPIGDWINEFEYQDYARLTRIIRTIQKTDAPDVWDAVWEEESFDGKSGKPKSCKTHAGIFKLAHIKPKNDQELARNPGMVYITSVSMGYNGERPGPCNW
jgi:type IV secretory pathway TrbF-like protein